MDMETIEILEQVLGQEIKRLYEERARQDPNVRMIYTDKIISLTRDYISTLEFRREYQKNGRDER